MGSVLNFVRDWLPSIAVLSGGAWVLYKWLFAENLRRQKEGPAIEGSVQATSVSLKSGKLLVTIEAIWHNRGVMPVRIDQARSGVDVFVVDNGLTDGPLDLKSGSEPLGKPIHEVRPYEERFSLVMEPGTESVLQTHFVLKTGLVYLFRWKLYRKIERGNPKSRTRYAILDATKQHE